ncbi:uncharacterized protein LOC143559482 [Bidens hawaiensis]|uniref:uncharacterized protein LOC143559482 n=1 Tax=Bidens hawaiensis TaxID=980011 RepID=UPI00404B52FE
MDEIKELHRKGSHINEENKEMHKKVSIMLQENAELQKKVYGCARMHHDNNEVQPPISLQLSPPQPLKHYLPTETMKLGHRVFESLTQAREPNLVLYNYPSFSGAFSALFAHIFHRHLNLPCLILPFSSVEPFKVEDLCVDGLQNCYFLDFLGPKGFAAELATRTSCRVIGFDHRKTTLADLHLYDNFNSNLSLQVNLGKNSSSAAYDYFSAKLSETKGDNVPVCLFEHEDQERVETVLKYIEDGDLRLWSLPDIKEFNIGLSNWRSKLNCITNRHMFEQLMKISVTDLVAHGSRYMASQQSLATKFLEKVFKVKLGRGLYGECLGVRIDGNPDLSDIIGKELSMKSEAAGLRPIGAAVYMQGRNLKMCLRSRDSCTDTSVIAKVYGGGGSLSSSSFIIRMDEYNQWISGN